MPKKPLSNGIIQETSVLVPVISIRDIDQGDDNKQLLATAIEKSAHPFLIGCADGRIVWFNPAFSLLTGYSEEELYTKSWNCDLTPPQWHTVQNQALEEIARTGQALKYEKEYLKKDGSRVPVEAFIHPFMDENGNIQYFYAFVSDMSVKNQAIEQLKKSEAQLREISDNMLDMIRKTDSKGIIQYASPSHQTVLGYSAESMLGKSVFDFVHPDDLDMVKDTVLKNIQALSSGRLEYRFRHADGHYLYLDTVGNLLFNEGEFTGVIFGSRDITERNQMEIALRLSEEKFAKAFKASPITVCISTFNDGRFIDVNDSFCEVIGYSREEILGLTSVDLGIWVNPADRLEIKQMIMEKESVRDLEYHFRLKSGEVRLGLYSGELLIIDGEPCLLAILTDITERRHLESEMTRLDRLDLVGRMAAIIGHEIRNPMTTVRGYLQLLKGKDKYTTEWEVFDLMIEELDRANSIITEFLSLTKDKMVQLDLKNLNTTVSNIFPLLQAHAMDQDKNIEIRLEKVPDLMLDEKEIRQLILNLVRNGLDAMSPGGTLTVKTYMDGEHPVLSIQDQGHGMNEEVLQKLGTPFFTTRQDGTGLGMAVCFGIVERHSATIEITTDDTGTCFEIAFPIAQPDPSW